MDVICNHCNKEFHIRPSFYKRNKTKIFYCCKQCMLDHKHVESKIVACNTCNKEINRRVTEIGKLNFCNQTCKLAYKPTIDLCCANCNETFTVDMSYYNKQSKRGQTPKYCSVECRVTQQRNDMETIDCIVCHKPFLLNKNKISVNGNCCSKKCRETYWQNNNNVATTCEHCGKDIIINKYRYDHSNKHFCDRECLFNYKAVKKETYREVAHYLRSSTQYETWRKECLKRDHYKCVKCHSKDNLHAHHINHLIDICEQYDMDIEQILNSYKFNNIDNGITLCSKCHALEHPFVQRDEKGRFCRPHSKPLKNEDN